MRERGMGKMMMMTMCNIHGMIMNMYGGDRHLR